MISGERDSPIPIPAYIKSADTQLSICRYVPTLIWATEPGAFIPPEIPDTVAFFELEILDDLRTRHHAFLFTGRCEREQRL